MLFVLITASFVAALHTHDMSVSIAFMRAQVGNALDIMEQFGPQLGYSCSGSCAAKIVLPLPWKFPCCNKRMCRWCLWEFVTKDPRYSPDLPCCSSDPGKIKEWHLQCASYVEVDLPASVDSTEPVSNSAAASSSQANSSSSVTESSSTAILSSSELVKYIENHADDLEGRTTEDLSTLIKHDLNAIGWNSKTHSALGRALKKANFETTRDKLGKNVYRLHRIVKRAKRSKKTTK